MAQVRLTVKEAAELWGVSLSAVHKWVQQGRVPVERVGGSDNTRAAALVIVDDARPERLPPNGLSGDQRGARTQGKRPRAAKLKAVKVKAAKKNRRATAAR